MSSDPALTLKTLPTPCLIVDRRKMLANVARLRGRLAGTGVTLRQHLKTVKSWDVARQILSSPQGPATVSTLKEAEEFGRRGVSDLLYAVCISPQKLDRVTALRRSGVDLKIVVDSVEAARSVAEHARATGDRIPALIEIDVDGHRSGVPLSATDRLVQIGKALQEGAELRGIMAHAGESYDRSDPVALAEAAEQERVGAIGMADALRAAGLPCPVVSVGSTPTGMSARSFAGITEFRAGVYVLFDLVQAGIGVCTLDDIALSVLATVIGHQREKGWIITDSGWTALSADRGTASQAVNQYFGVVCDERGRPYEDIVVLKVNQEHGIVAPRPGTGARVPELPVGARLRILPNHACATSTMHDRYYALDKDSDEVEVWPRFRGW